MAYVPGYQHDIFISYAHGDDREWINRFVDRLAVGLKRRLSAETSIWIDDADLRKTRDFRAEIPDSLRSSALFLFLPSPTYVRSTYCVEEECRIFQETLAERRTRFNTEKFAKDLFALRCPILPVENNEHWELIQGLTDIAFCDQADTLAIGSAEFEASFRSLTGELISLLQRMRNHSTPVFLYPPNPGAELQEAYQRLSVELSASGYRILPDRKVNLAGQLREASLSVFLLGEAYNEQAQELAEIASQQEKPWVVWCSPAATQNGSEEQIGFSKYLDQLDSASKTYLNESIAPGKLTEEILSALRSRTSPPPAVARKPRVYLIYNSRDATEKGNAGLIVFHYRKAIDFDLPDDPGQHTRRLMGSDGVLLVWGNADEKWCSREFAEMVQAASPGGAKGLCLFDPQETKAGLPQQIRAAFSDLYVAEQFGKFDPARLETFFNPILRRARAAQS